MSIMAPRTRLRVPELLKAKEMSASELARRSGVSWPTAQGLAAGKPMNLTLETMEKVAGALEVGVEELFAGEESG